MVLVLGVELLIGVLTFAALLANAREAVQEELAASERLAVGLVRATLASLVPVVPRVDLMAELAGRLPTARHVRFLVVDSRGDPQPTVEEGVRHGDVPWWLYASLAVSARSSEIAVVVDGRTYGKVLVIADPRDEIVEIWRDLRGILVIGGLGFGILTTAVWAGTVWALRPLRKLREALERARGGDLDVRLEPPAIGELVPLVETFNALMRELGRTRAEREALTRRLVAAEDAERRAVALELHDEVGPCLFALRAELAGLERAIRRDAGKEELANRSKALLHVVRTLEEAQRRVLAHLRPIRPPGVRFTQQIGELLSESALRSEGMDWSVELDPAVDRAGEVAQVTIYRLIQEAVTNVLRHARASHVRVAIRREGDGFRVLVADDGRGFDTRCTRGLGLHGMRERVQGLGGSFEVETACGKGTRIRAWIPDEGDQGGGEAVRGER